jgi:hypothetical protein
MLPRVAEVQSDMKHFSFKVDLATKPQVEVQIKGETKRFPPGEISSLILLKMKEPLKLISVPKLMILRKERPYLLQEVKAQNPKLIEL